MSTLFSECGMIIMLYDIILIRSALIYFQKVVDKL